MDEFRVDSHKLIYHVDKVYKWVQGKDIYPIYMEISPFGGCNHRCIFCALDYLEYKSVSLETQVLKGFLKDIAARGVKSVMFAGEGEPLLHKDIIKLVIHARNNGLDVAITTNGVLLSKDVLEKILSSLSWLRISLNAGTPKTYSLIHRTKMSDFKKVFDNIDRAIKLRKKKRYHCTIGAQLLLLNENFKEVLLLAKKLKSLGADYLIIKPYSQHPHSYNRLKLKIDYNKLSFLGRRLEKYCDKNFKVIFRKKTMDKLREKKPYDKCLGISFWSYLTAIGDLYACSAFLGDERFCYGNILKDSFEVIWRGKKRKEIADMMANSWNTEDCREICRLDEINRYLWELKNPPPHVNFI